MRTLKMWITTIRITVFVKMFDRKKGRTSRKILKRTNFITVEHFYEDGNHTTSSFSPFNVERVGKGGTIKLMPFFL